MAKDYFQDIVPPSDSNNGIMPRRTRAAAPPKRLEPIEPEAPLEEVEDSEEYADDDISHEDVTPVAPAPRGIRNISMPTRSRSMRTPMMNNSRIPGTSLDMREVPPIGRGMPVRPRRKSSRAWIWILVVLCVLVIGFLGMFMFRQTTVTITPRSQSVTFDQTAQLTAYPQATAATGTLPYTVATTDLSDSETVQGNGTTATQSKASGSITVYNNYSTASVKLIANTRFETPAGLIFRTPNAIVIPGKTASAPGSVTVTVIADQAGPQYDIGPTARFTVPGLPSTSAEYAGVYAASTGSMTGGSSGTQESVSDSVRSAAVSDIRTRLAQDVAQYVQSQVTASTTAFASLAEITYTDMPDTDATGTQVQINETAHVELPVFDSATFATTVAQAMAITTDNTPVMLVAGSGYGAQSTDSSPVNLGTDPIDFSLVGNATVIWSVDTSALAQALAGRDQNVFQTIIGGFAGIETASARIEPFWSGNFPSDPSKIKIVVENPGSSSGAAK